LIPALAIDAEARRARLHVRPLAGRAAHRTIAVIWRKGSALEPALREIAAVLRAAYPATETKNGMPARRAARKVREKPFAVR